MSVVRFASMWLLFSVSYVVFCGFIFALLPERAIYFFIREHYNIFIEEIRWDTVFMLVVLLLALVANIVFIILSLTATSRLRNRIKQSD